MPPIPLLDSSFPPSLPASSSFFFNNPLRQISAAHAHGYSWLHDHTVGHGQPANGQPPRKVTLHLIVVINGQCSSSTWSGASGSLTLPFWSLLSYIGCMQVTTVLVSSCITALSFPIGIFFFIQSIW